MTDAELAVRARRGDELAMRRIMHRHAGLLHSIAENYFLPGGEFDDLLQEARLGAFKAIRDFDEDAGTFWPFLVLCIRRQVITAVQMATREKHGPLNDAVSFSQPLIGGDDVEDLQLGDLLADEMQGDPSAVLQAKEELRTLGSTFATLTKSERTAVSGIAAGFSYEQLAGSSGTDAKSIDNATQRGRRKLRNALAAVA